MKLYNKQQVMEMLGISQYLFGKYIKDGILPARKIDGKRYIFTEDDIKAFLDNIKVDNQSEKTVY